MISIPAESHSRRNDTRLYTEPEQNQNQNLNLSSKKPFIHIFTYIAYHSIISFIYMKVFKSYQNRIKIVSKSNRIKNKSKKRVGRREGKIKLTYVNL